MLAPAPLPLAPENPRTLPSYTCTPFGPRAALSFERRLARWGETACGASQVRCRWAAVEVRIPKKVRTAAAIEASVAQAVRRLRDTSRHSCGGCHASNTELQQPPLIGEG